MTNPLAKQHNLFSLVKFALPSMLMMLFSSLYVIVDGIFVLRVLRKLQEQVGHPR